jgi:hypothetical protein
MKVVMAWLFTWVDKRRGRGEGRLSNKLNHILKEEWWLD